MQTRASILDFPRKALSEDLWLYETPQDLPRLRPDLRSLIITTANRNLQYLHLSLSACNLYGGAASYQWSENSDIDISLYASGWPQDIGINDVEKCQSFFKKLKVPYKGFEIHFFLKDPGEKNREIAEAVYDVLGDEWVLPPLVLPAGFDPDIYFKPFIKAAEDKCKKLDLEIGKLKRSWHTLLSASSAQTNAQDPAKVKDRIAKEKNLIKTLTYRLVDEYLTIREKRYALHDQLRNAMQCDQSVGRFARFQQPEIIWKYLDRSGYVEFLNKLHQTIDAHQLDTILNKY